MEENKKEKKHTWFYILIGLMVVFVACGIIGSCLRRGLSESEITIDPNAVFTQVAQTVVFSMTQTAASNPDFIHTQVAGTMIAQAVQNESNSAQVAEPTIEPTIAAPQGSFEDGIWQIGIDIQPGTYRTEGSAYCYWERLSGFGGTFDEIIANANPSGPSIVTISPSDIGFASTRCGIWVLQSEQIVAAVIPKSSFGDGTWRVGIDIQAGTYRTDGSDSCYWERLSGFGGTFDNIIANANQAGSAIITISPSDAGFSTVRCGTWISQQ